MYTFMLMYIYNKDKKSILNKTCLTGSRKKENKNFK